MFVSLSFSVGGEIRLDLFAKVVSCAPQPPLDRALGQPGRRGDLTDRGALEVERLEQAHLRQWQSSQGALDERTLLRPLDSRVTILGVWLPGIVQPPLDRTPEVIAQQPRGDRREPTERAIGNA